MFMEANISDTVPPTEDPQMWIMIAYKSLERSKVVQIKVGSTESFYTQWTPSNPATLETNQGAVVIDWRTKKAYF